MNSASAAHPLYQHSLHRIHRWRLRSNCIRAHPVALFARRRRAGARALDVVRRPPGSGGEQRRAYHRRGPGGERTIGPARSATDPPSAAPQRSAAALALQAALVTVMPRLPPPGRNFGSCQPGSWTYHELADAGATCLDGSRYGFYYMPAVATVKPTKLEHAAGVLNNQSWLLHFEGGGWCWSPEDCAVRAETRAGSSKDWDKQEGQIHIGGVVNKCCFCTKFCRFHRVYLKSCDGHAFSGDATIAAPAADPVVGAASSAALTPLLLHSAGQAILRAVIGTLIAHFGLGDAKSVLVAGCSAGGMAALLNAERIRQQLRTAGARIERFKVASMAGVFFPSVQPPPQSSSPTSLAALGAGRPQQPHDNLTPFEEQVRAVARLGNVALPASCAATSDAWRCLLGLGLVEALPADVPAFIFQSRLDLWQTNCILAAGRSRYFELNCSTPEWRRCLGWMAPLKPSSRCSPEQWRALRLYEEANDAALRESRALRRPGYGTFTHSCYDHCPTTSGLLNTGATLRPGSVNDSINLRESLHLWFLERQPPFRNAPVPASNHTHAGCMNWPVSAMVPGKEQPPWCRRPECAMPEKLHHDDGMSKRERIRARGWRWFLDEAA